jgi:hypothetical protein
MAPRVSALQFVASLVNSLAWPLAVVVIALVFRVQIRRLMTGQLRRLRAGPVEMEFDRLLSEVGVELATPKTTAPPNSDGGSPLIDEFADVALVSPLAAVLDGHAAVEQALRELIAKVDPGQAGRKVGTARLTSTALAKGLITPETAKAIEGITVMRNLAAHGQANEVTSERARGYLALVDAVLFTIRQGTGA